MKPKKLSKYALYIKIKNKNKKDWKTPEIGKKEQNTPETKIMNETLLNPKNWLKYPQKRRKRVFNIIPIAVILKT